MGINKKKTGRPKKEIDQKNFEGLCGLQCTRAEMCQFFGVSDKLLDRWCNEIYGLSFSAIFKVKRGTGIISLRRAGFELARTNGSVWIFLSKNYLGLKDNPVDEAGLLPAQPVTVNIVIQDCKVSDNKANR